MKQQLSESKLVELIAEKMINEGMTDEWFDNIRAYGRGIANRWGNAVQTGKGVVNALKNGDINGAGSELGKGVVRGVTHRAENLGQYIGDKVQNYRDVWNGAKRVISGATNGFTNGFQNGINRNDPQAAQQTQQANTSTIQRTSGAPQRQQKQPAKAPNQRIMQLQRALSAAGYNPGPLDGLVGPKTMAAAQQAGVDVKTWQPGTVIKSGPLAAQKLNPETPTPAPVDSAQVLQNMKIPARQLS